MRDIIKNVKYVLQKRTFKSTDSFLNLKKNLCTPEYFRQRLAIEKRRTERLNYKSSIIIFNLNLNLNNNGYHDNPLELNPEDVLKVLFSNLRETDDVCLIKDDVILILLPDTDSIGSQYVCEKIINTLIKNYLPSKELTYDDFAIEILSYPEKETEKKLPKEVISNKIKAENIKNRDKTLSLKLSNSVYFKRDYIENLNLCIYSTNGSSIAILIVDTFFWDEQLVSNFVLLIEKNIKRAIDIIGSMTGLILLSPVLLLIALLIKITSPGPILFKQKRVGYGGKNFTFLKFRSMYNNCGNHTHHEFVKKFINGNNKEINNGSRENPFYKMKNDPRITPVGKFLRKTGMDELPQLLNVLNGNMSLVGPRPPIDYEVNEYKNWHYRRLLEVKPGITGLWQVSGRSRTTFDEMVRFDIYYAKNWSLFMDVKILLKTIIAIFKAEGT